MPSIRAEAPAATISVSVSYVSFPATTVNGRLAEVHRSYRAGLELRAEALRLFARIFDQLRPQNAIGKAREIFHHRGQGQLAARLVAIQHQRIQIRARRIDRRSQPGAATSDDDHLMH